MISITRLALILNLSMMERQRKTSWNVFKHMHSNFCVTFWNWKQPANKISKPLKVLFKFNMFRFLKVLIWKHGIVCVVTCCVLKLWISFHYRNWIFIAFASHSCMKSVTFAMERKLHKLALQIVIVVMFCRWSLWMR